jgi:uncharacterized membrane protein YkvA (DUF1232 family)
MSDPTSTFDDEQFWTKVRRTLGRVPFMDDAVSAFYCAQDPDTPRRVRGVLLGALAYFVLPVDMIPDLVVGFGFTDDATVLATALAMVSGHIKPAHRDQADRFLEKEPESQN